MVVARLEHAAAQAALGTGLRKAFEFLVASKGADLPEGRIDLDGDRIFALVQSYETAADPTLSYEFHRKYIDVQYIVGGEEAIAWMPVESIRVTGPYDGAKDAGYGEAARGRPTLVCLSAGELAVFQPSDAHAPKQAAGGEPSTVRKIVVKVSVDAR